MKLCRIALLWVSGCACVSTCAHTWTAQAPGSLDMTLAFLTEATDGRGQQVSIRTAPGDGGLDKRV